MNIEIWSIGKDHDPFIAEGISFYEKRLKPYCTTQLIRIPPPRRSGNTTAAQSLLLEEKLFWTNYNPPTI
jgi:23S rRNA (pseudouridine1915-N3)-methyltransferase